MLVDMIDPVNMSKAELMRGGMHVAMCKMRIIKEIKTQRMQHYFQSVQNIK